MSTDLENYTLPEGFTFTQFWGGAARGQCLQITGPLHNALPCQLIQVTPEQARTLASALFEWAETVKPFTPALTEAQRQRLHRKVQDVFKPRHTPGPKDGKPLLPGGDQ